MNRTALLPSLSHPPDERAQWLNRYVFIALFSVLTILPLISMTIGMTIVKPVDENRSLAGPPTWSWPPHLRILAREADRWFNDHFGLRSLLIRLKTQIDFSIFRTSSRVHIGSNGWLFYRSVMDIEKPALEDLLSKRETDVIAGVATFNEVLRENGVRLIIVPNLLSDRFVPSELPGTIPHLPSPPRLDHLLAELAALPDLAYVDTPAILKQTQRTRPVFHKTDFHWNDPGAFEVAHDLVDLIARMDGRERSVWNHKLEIETKRESGGIAMFMPLFLPPSENSLFLKKTWTDPVGRKVLVNQGPYEDIVHNLPSVDLLPSTLLVGDSFLDGILRSGFDNYFRDMYRVRWTSRIKISDIAAALPVDTRYVVLQFIEVNGTALSAFADRADVAFAISILRSHHPAPATTPSP